MQSSSTDVAQDLATLAREAFHRQTDAAADELQQRTETRKRELAQAAATHLKATLAAVDVRDEAILIEDVHADPFDQFGGWVRLTVDGIPVVYAYCGPETSPTLAIVATCHTCGQETPGDGFDTLASLGAALARPSFVDPERHACRCAGSETSTADKPGITTHYGREDR